MSRVNNLFCAFYAFFCGSTALFRMNRKMTAARCGSWKAGCVSAPARSETQQQLLAAKNIE